MSRVETGKEYLEHYGVLGMKWGIRKQPDGGIAKTGSADDDSTGYEPNDPGKQAEYTKTSKKPNSQQRKKDEKRSSKSKITPERKKQIIRNATIAAGTLAVVAGSTFVATLMSRNGNDKASEKNVSDKVKEHTESTFEPPTDVLLATRGKNKGFKFHRTGNAPNPMAVFDRAAEANGGNYDMSNGFFERIGDDNELIAAVFNDPQGRKDRAGRVIPHTVVVPKSMTEGINNVEDVKSKIWPLIEDDYDYT